MDPQRPHLLRIYKKWKNKEEFDEILQILRQYPAGIERVSLFTGDVHTPLTLEETRRRADILRDRFRALSAAGAWRA